MSVAVVVYILTGIFVVWMFYKKLEKSCITGDVILSTFSDEDRLYFYDHPNQYRIMVICASFVMVCIWPYVLYKIEEE